MNYNKILSDKTFRMTADNLFCRWLDECMYEDINEYAKVLMSAMQKANGTPFNVTDVVGCKRPFGVKFTTTSDNKRWQFKRTMTSISLMRIK